MKTETNGNTFTMFIMLFGGIGVFIAILWNHCGYVHNPQQGYDENSHHEHARNVPQKTTTERETYNPCKGLCGPTKTPININRCISKLCTNERYSIQFCMEYLEYLTVNPDICMLRKNGQFIHEATCDISTKNLIRMKRLFCEQI